MPVTDEAARSWLLGPLTPTLLDDLTAIEGIRVVLGAHSAEQLLRSPRWARSVHGSWDLETVSAGAFFPRQLNGAVVITVAEGRTMKQMMRRVLALFHVEEGIISTRATWLSSAIRNIENPPREMTAAGVLPDEAMYDSNRQDLAFLINLGGAGVRTDENSPPPFRRVSRFGSAGLERS